MVTQGIDIDSMLRVLFSLPKKELSFKMRAIRCLHQKFGALPPLWLSENISNFGTPWYSSAWDVLVNCALKMTGIFISYNCYLYKYQSIVMISCHHSIFCIVIPYCGLTSPFHPIFCLAVPYYCVYRGRAYCTLSILCLSPVFSSSSSL